MKQQNNLQFEIRHLTFEQMVKLMKVNGAKEFTIETIEQDVENGLPLNEDGTINIFDYWAWRWLQGCL